MTVKQLILIAVILLFHNSEAGRPRQQPTQNPPLCNMEERSYLFNNCLMVFGIAHMNDKADMSRAPRCLSAKLQCPAAGRAVECINRLPPNAGISDNCRRGMKRTLSLMLMEYGFGCTYDDIEKSAGELSLTSSQARPPSEPSMATEDVALHSDVTPNPTPPVGQSDDLAHSSRKASLPPLTRSPSFSMQQ